MRLASCLLVAATLAIGACKGRDSIGVRVTTTHPARTDDDGTGEGENAIAGLVGGAPFSDVATAFVIESPAAEATTVVYLSSTPLRCLDSSFAGWDHALAGGTMILELTVSGTTPGSFLVVTEPPLSPREGAAEWTRTSARGEPQEARSSGGWVTFDSLAPKGAAKGTFDLAFGTDHLKGKFGATFCPGGSEP